MSVADRMPELRAWYRDAMASRLAELEDAVRVMLDGTEGAALDAAAAAVRRVAHGLAGSGGSYGFPFLTEAGRHVEDAHPSVLLAAAIGLGDAVADVAYGADRDPELRCHRWLEHGAGPLPGGVLEALSPGPSDPTEAWARTARALGMDDPGDLLSVLSTRLGTAVADLETPGDAARLLVPPRLALDHGVLPLREDGVRLWAASAVPTDLPAILALRRMTGRTPVLEIAEPAALRDALARALDGRQPPGSASAAVPDTEPGPARVLLVDDEEDARLLARAVLEKEGYEVVEAPDGLAAFRRLEDEPVDVVVVDLHMPRLDGTGFVQRLRADPLLAHIPVVVLTGVRNPGKEAELIEAGADDYLRKPLDPRLFLARVRATLRRAATARSSP